MSLLKDFTFRLGVSNLITLDEMVFLEHFHTASTDISVDTDDTISRSLFDPAAISTHLKVSRVYGGCNLSAHTLKAETILCPNLSVAGFLKADGALVVRSGVIFYDGA